MLRCAWQIVLIVLSLSCIATAQATRGTASPSTNPAVQMRFEQTNRLSRLTGRGPADPDVRGQFIQIERIARLPSTNERAAQIPLVYRELATPSLMANNNETGLMAVSGNLFAKDQTYARNDFTAQYAAQLDEAAKTMSSEEVADKIAAIHNSAILQIAARRRVMWIFNQDMPALKALIDADLASDDLTALKRAFGLIEGMKLKEYAPQAVRVLLADGPAAPSAELALDLMGGAEGAELLITAAETKPELVKRYASLLSRMLISQPPDPSLIKLLDSPDPDIRAAVATALSRTDPNSAIELAPKLLADADERVRLTGLDIAFRLPTDVFGSIRTSVLPSLSSSSMKERVRAAEGLARKRDPACARTLLEFAKDPQFPTEYRMTTSRAIRELMGQQGPMMYDSRNWGSGATGLNATMISQLQQWIASQPQ